MANTLAGSKPAKTLYLFLGVSALIQLLIRLPLPEDSITWAISAPYGLAFVAVLGYSAYLKKGFTIIALGFCGLAWVISYFLHFTPDTIGGVARYDLKYGILLYASQTIIIAGLWSWEWRWRSDLKWMCMLSLAMAGFGAVIYFFEGRYINSIDHYWWRFIWNQIYLLTLAASWWGDNEPKVTESRRQYEQFQAAA